mgnify:CR=1 FL=1
MKLSCNVIQDLIPLVKDQVASEETTKLVLDHIKDCPICKREFGEEQNKIAREKIKEDKKIIQGIKRSIYVSKVVILIIGALIGSVLTNTMGMFYNFLIMPTLGVISYFVFKKRAYLMILMVFALSYAYITISSIVIDGFYWGFFYGSLFYSLIYSILVFIGIIISLLLTIAFRKDR